MSEAEIIKKLSEIPRSYDTFVAMTMSFIDQYGIGEQLMRYIDKNPNVNASDVAKETHRLVYGVIL